MSAYVCIRRVQNGHLYIKYRSRSIRKQSSGMQKSHILHLIAFLLLVTTLQIPLIYLTVKKTKSKRFNSVYLSLFFVIFITHNSKIIRILYKPKDRSINRDLPFLAWSCAWFMTGELQPQNYLKNAVPSCSNTSLAFHAIIVLVCACVEFTGSLKLKVWPSFCLCVFSSVTLPSFGDDPWVAQWLAIISST